MKTDTKKWLLFGPFGIITLLLTIWFFTDIYQENLRVQKIKGVDEKVIHQLKKIRIAQKAYLSVNKTYCNDWDSLFAFLETGTFVNIQKAERVIALPTGVDSVIVKIDTLAVVAVYDSLKTELNCSRAAIKTMNRVPVSDTVFTLRADKMGNGQNICEVRDPKPLNPRRQKNGDLKPLQIGSLQVSTLQGNWE